MSGISNHYDSMISIAAIIKSIGLDGISQDPIVQDVLNYKNVTPPCVLIAPFGTEAIEAATNVRDDVGYPIGIAIVAQAGTDDIDTTLEQRLSWREQIRRRMHNRALDGNGGSILVPLNFNLKCKPVAAVDLQAWMNDQKFVSGMVVQSWCQEPRQ